MDNSNPEEISLQEIGQTLWSRRLLILGMVLFSGAVSIILAFTLPQKYEASVVLSPVDEDAAASKLGGAGALLSQFGGLAGLSGISLGGSGKKAEAVATLQSAALTEGFIAERNLLPVLFRSKWDADKKTWNTSDPDEIPTLWKAEKKFRKKIRSVNEDKKTGLVTLTLTWRDPQQAADWANELVTRANRSLRTRAIEQSKKNLEYLNEQLAKTSVVELQKAIYGLTESEIKKIMIANGSDEYAFRVIDPARVAEERSSPLRGVMISVGFLAGLMLGIVMALAGPKRSRDTG